MEQNYKEVYYEQFCKTCKHKDLKDFYDPCNDCLDNPVNTNSQRPVNYKEAEKQKGGE